MILAGQLTIGALNLFLRGILCHSQDSIIVFELHLALLRRTGMCGPWPYRASLPRLVYRRFYSLSRWEKAGVRVHGFWTAPPPPLKPSPDVRGPLTPPNWWGEWRCATLTQRALRPDAASPPQLWVSAR